MPFIAKNKPRPQPISDPLQDLARPEKGVDTESFISKKELQALPPSPYLPYGTFFTTTAFSQLSKSYTRHCAPTAMTNALCTLWNRQADVSSAASSVPGSEKASDPYPAPPAEIFEEVARIGQSRLFYTNMDLFKRIGGSSVLLMDFYLRKVLRRFGFSHLAVKSRPVASRASLLRELKAGRLLVLHLLFHPIYGSHEVVCYGIKAFPDAAGNLHPYLLLADGWNASLRYLPLSGLRVFGYLSIG